MVNINSQIEREKRRRIFKRSMLASAVMAMAASSFAQDDAASEIVDEEVVVTGTRANLQNAQDIKREADTFVDSISAKDIGVLPDRSVLEAIQRLPGVSVERFAGPDDPDHFSVEGSGAIIRGMTATRSEFNGRDSFTANSGRGLSFQDVSPELMGGVDVFKNQTADMIEGGIGGTISLRTRKPFDSQGQVIAFNFDYSYGDMAEEGTPTFSALYSNRWETGAGEFGFLVNYADSELVGESHGIQSDAYVEYAVRLPEDVNLTDDDTRPPYDDLAWNDYTLPGAERFLESDGSGTVYVPNASNLLMKTDERERKGAAVAIQFENTDETFLATFQYIRSDARLAWNERAVKYQGGYNDIYRRRSRPLEGTEWEFDDNGLFVAGSLTNGDSAYDGWRVHDAETGRVPHAWNGFPQFGHKVQYDSRVSDNRALVEDFALNFQWQVTDNFELETDLQYIQAETDNDDLTVHTGGFASQIYDTRGSTPTLELLEPWHGARDADPDSFATGYPGFSGDPAGDSNYFQDPNNYFWRSAMDHYERSEGDSTAFRMDGTYHFEDAGLLRSVKAGVRYAKREQTVRTTNWNWGALAPEWDQSEAGIGWLTDPETASQSGDWEFVDWSDFMHGGVASIEGNQTIHATEEFVRSLMGANPAREPYYNSSSSWNGGQPQQMGVITDDGYGLFEPSEINEITETNNAIYVRLDFGDDSALPYAGNVGVRYVTLNRKSTGFVQFPDLLPDNAAPVGLSLPLTPAAVLAEIDRQVAAGDYPDRETALQAESNAWVGDRNNYLSAADRAFGNNASDFLEADEDFRMFLPSFNFKLEMRDDLIGRFAIAKAVAMPDIGDVRNQVNVGAQDILEVRQSPADPMNPQPEEQILVGAAVSSWEGSGGNPYLKPMTSIQYDLSLEWYFADVGQLTGTLFHKDLSHIFVQGASYQQLTNPVSGATVVADITSTRNGGDAKMNGFELSYQQFFDRLPSPWDGVGVQMTYTYIDAAGVDNNEQSYDDADWVGLDANDTGIRVSLDKVPLQGQSKDTFNLVAMYEKYGWSARLAYNWRSRYLLTTRDVISKAPLFYDDHGQLDGSIFYNVTDNITVGLQATNITNSQSETIMIINNDMLETGRSWFQADRRLAFVVKGSF